MSKPLAVVSCPIDTYSGYGARARDFVKALIKLDKYDVKILSQRWGNTRYGYLKDHEESELTSKIIPNLTTKPKVWIQITVPNEFQPVGEYNIGVTAGMETNLVHPTWIEGCNRMNLILTSSTHSANVFKQTKAEIKDKNNKTVKTISLQTPVEVLLEGLDITKYFETDSNLDLSSIKEDYCYLFVGHWMQGKFGEDRKNVGFLVKAFLESFKNKPKQPALILKATTVGSSILDRERLLTKIDEIRSKVRGKLPNIYLFHGETSDKTMNDLYNHPKVKTMVSFTKGEGFGRPLLEFAASGKPIIASGWSGQIDFLKADKSILIGGELKPVDDSAIVKDMIIKESSWFSPNVVEVGKAFKESFKNYKKLLVNGKKQRRFILDNFSFDNMVDALKISLDKNVPEFPEQVQLNLPKLNLPKLS